MPIHSEIFKVDAFDLINKLDMTDKPRVAEKSAPSMHVTLSITGS